jgi:hypothetical protein
LHRDWHLKPCRDTGYCSPQVGLPRFLSFLPGQAVLQKQTRFSMKLRVLKGKHFHNGYIYRFGEVFEVTDYEAGIILSGNNKRYEVVSEPKQEVKTAPKK